MAIEIRKPVHHHHHHEEPEREAENHVHVFLTMVTAAHDHQHLLTGVTGPAIMKHDSHVHPIHVRTSFDPKNGPAHWHEVETCTGPDLEAPDGEHTHYYCGDTSFDLDHCHTFGSVVDTAPDTQEAEEEEEACEEEPVYKSKKR